MSQATSNTAPVAQHPADAGTFLAALQNHIALSAKTGDVGAAGQAPAGQSGNMGKAGGGPDGQSTQQAAQQQDPTQAMNYAQRSADGGFANGTPDAPVNYTAQNTMPTPAAFGQSNLLTQNAGSNYTAPTDRARQAPTNTLTAGAVQPQPQQQATQQSQPQQQAMHPAAAALLTQAQQYQQQAQQAAQPQYQAAQAQPSMLQSLQQAGAANRLMQQGL